MTVELLPNGPSHSYPATRCSRPLAELGVKFACSRGKLYIGKSHLEKSH